MSTEHLIVTSHFTGDGEKKKRVYVFRAFPIRHTKKISDFNLFGPFKAVFGGIGAFLASESPARLFLFSCAVSTRW